MSLQIEVVVTGPFAENSLIVYDGRQRVGVLVDPGDDAAILIDAVSRVDVKIMDIFATHGHLDHVGAARQLADYYQVGLAIHQDEESVLSALPMQAAMFGLPNPGVPPKVTRWLEEGDELAVGGFTGRVLHTPGHTPGGCCFLFDDVVICGDTLFAGSVGRSDLPGGNGHQLISSIRNKLLVLDDELTVYCGHGPTTTIGQERHSNPFIM